MLGLAGTMMGMLVVLVVAFRRGRPPTRWDAGDWIDVTLGLPQTVGTYARCGPGPGGLTGRAAADALAGRVMPRPPLLDRRLKWPAAVLVVASAAGFVGRAFTASDPRPRAGLASFADVGVVLGGPTPGAAARPTSAARPATTAAGVTPATTVTIQFLESAALQGTGGQGDIDRPRPEPARSQIGVNPQPGVSVGGTAGDRGRPSTDGVTAASAARRPAAGPRRAVTAADIGPADAAWPPALRDLAAEYFAEPR